MLIIFMFLTGTAGSTALSNVAGTIADLFGDVDGAGQAMALFVVSADVGPSLGSPVGGWITGNASLGLRWIFLINVIIGCGFAVVMCFIPETLPRLVIAKAVAKSAEVEADERAILTSRINVLQELRFVATMTFRIMLTEPIVLCLGLYNGFTYGILFLFLDGVFDVFVVNNGLSIISADLTYLNFVVGVIVMFCFVPVQTWFYARDRTRHGSAIAAFLIPSFMMAAGLAHLGVLMFENMSTKWGMATIGFISFSLCAMIYFVYFFGARIRMRSKLARTF
ncbi:hypothetical protein BUE80_DR012617 [Diplocarpon rosae]|nr:hypothetical protein BUE80_DR012617 [Diplocarpon rosae]